MPKLKVHAISVIATPFQSYIKIKEIVFTTESIS